MSEQPATFHILLVEDEPQTAQMVRFYVENEKLTLMTAPDGPAGEIAFQEQRPDLLILDIMLPGFDGLELCRRIRQHSNVPILMLTARTTDVDKAIGLGIGADDYLTKPFSPTELIARIKALLRRAYRFNEPKQSVILGGPRLELDVDRHQVTLDGAICDVTKLEFSLLRVLMANPGWAFTRSHLLETIWGYHDEAGEDTVTVHISNLRQKLGNDGPKLIRTVRGIGYTYQED